MPEYTVQYSEATNRALDIAHHREFRPQQHGGNSHPVTTTTVKFSPDGRLLAAGSNHETVVSLSTTTNPRNNKDIHVRSVCFSPDGTKIAEGSEDHLIRIWDIQTQQIETTLQGHDAEVYSLDYAPNGTLVSGSGDRTIRIWDLPTNGPNSTLLTHSALPVYEFVTSVSVSPDGNLIAVGYMEGRAKIWNLPSTTGVPERTLTGHTDGVFSVAFSPDGRKVFTASLDKTVQCWDLTQPVGAGPLLTLQGHSDFVLRCLASPDGEWLFTSSKDRTAKVWNAQTGALYATLNGNINSVIGLDISPSGEYLATAGVDPVNIWKLTML